MSDIGKLDIDFNPYTDQTPAAILLEQALSGAAITPQSINPSSITALEKLFDTLDQTLNTLPKAARREVYRNEKANK